MVMKHCRMSTRDWNWVLTPNSIVSIYVHFLVPYFQCVCLSKLRHTTVLQLTLSLLCFNHIVLFQPLAASFWHHLYHFHVILGKVKSFSLRFIPEVLSCLYSHNSTEAPLTFLCLFSKYTHTYTCYHHFCNPLILHF